MFIKTPALAGTLVAGVAFAFPVHAQDTEEPCVAGQIARASARDAANRAEAVFEFTRTSPARIAAALPTDPAEWPQVPAVADQVPAAADKAAAPEDRKATFDAAQAALADAFIALGECQDSVVDPAPEPLTP